MRILLVEDDDDHLHLIQRAFRRCKTEHQVVSARCLGEARHSLQACCPELIITDLKLPDGFGVELLSDKMSNHHCPIVIMTCCGDERSAVQALKLGAIDYVVKSAEEFRRMPEIAEDALQLWQLRLAQVGQEEALREANQRLKQLATRDALTELLNRRGLEEELERLARQTNEQDIQHVVALVDCDNFKDVNTTLGHSAGDLVLSVVAKRMRDAMRSSDIIARVGGDEFILLFPYTGLGAGLKLAERLREAVSSEPILTDTAQVPLSVSVGVSSIGCEDITIDELLKITRAALGLSKTYGKNRVATADGSILGMTDGWTKDLDQALCDAKRIGIRAQPVFDLIKNQVVAYELFSRGTIQPLESPSDFFRVAEERELLTQVDINCLQACLRSAPGLLGVSDVDLHLNIFPSTILTMPLEDLAETLRLSIPLRQLFLELNVQYIVGDPGPLRERVRALQGLGVRVALDDVGFGRSCLETLIVLEPDAVKIDRVLVDGVNENEGKRRALSRLVQVASCLKADVYAEGVERQADLTVLRELGVRYAQGYFWGKPRRVPVIIEGYEHLVG